LDVVGGVGEGEERGLFSREEKRRRNHLRKDSRQKGKRSGGTGPRVCLDGQRRRKAFPPGAIYARKKGRGEKFTN